MLHRGRHAARQAARRASELTRRAQAAATLSRTVRVAGAAPGSRRGFFDSATAGPNAMYLESIYTQWKASPGSLDPKWNDYFEAIESGKASPLPVAGNALRSTAQEAQLSRLASSSPGFSAGAGAVAAGSTAGGLQNLIRAYQKRGHEAANLDPLGMHEWREFFSTGVPELEPSYHGFTEADLDKPFEINFPGITSGMTLREILGGLKKVYANTVGFQYRHIEDLKKVEWLRTKIEDPAFIPTSKEKLVSIYKTLAKVDAFEAFLGTKYKTTKRFGCDGGEAAVAGISAAIEKAVDLGVTDVVIGMPHRGRLNILTNVVGKPLVQMFAEFKGTHYDFDELMDVTESADWAFAGDVKYHLGTSNVMTYPSGKKATITLEANPSHLETVNTVTLGRSRAKQFYMGNTEDAKKKVMPVLFHGDASFSGQGVCYETMQLAHVTEFGVGGTIHVIINNQIGFTTDPIDDRSTLYCSDLGKAFDIPIFHCNGDDPAGVIAAFELAAEYRQTFGTDVIMDVICYRRFGHNESLNPDYTQPVLYKKIGKHPRAELIFREKLLGAGIGVTQQELDSIKKEIWDYHEDAFLKSDDFKGEAFQWVATKWDGMVKPFDEAHGNPTGLDIDHLKKIGKRLCEFPEGFAPHSGLKRQLKKKAEDLEAGTEIDWAAAEGLAFGSLLLEGTHVRITGQDVQSGTFAHRHCVAKDQKNQGKEYTFLNNLNMGPQETFIARNSILAEYAVLGFELGYTYENPHSLNIWEAQFGDFANTAQVMIDQFISAGEHKWLQQTGLVMLLPHGYEGQGAEHSSCRIERFLQLSDDDEDDIPEFEKDFGRGQIQKANWQVCNVTTPANVFHVFRRQQHRDFRKPLVVASTKSLFRHKLCKSNISDFGPGTRFQRLLHERNQEISENPDNVDRLVFCSGKVYYDLVEMREKLGIKNVAIITLEQIAPFPFDRVLEVFEKYKKVDIGDGVHPGNVCWVQEEPKNMGCWSYVRPRFVTTAREGMDYDLVMRYVGRRAAASPATGYAKVHHAEQEALVKEALLGHDDENWAKHRPSKLLGHQT
jgi:2-oxoglutarate dehydrogenase E1 component